MIFNSAVFLVFIALFFAFWPLAKRRNNPRWIYITIASFIFYGWWDWRFLFLLIFSGMVDYLTAIGMEKTPEHKKLFLYLSLSGNLGSLFIFKYSGFAAHELDYILNIAGVHFELYSHIPPFALILPIGISFYTFQSLNYIIDVYHGQLKATRNIFHFFAYLSLFPHLVAGPILRARSMLPQMKELHIPAETEIWEGTKLIASGFFKKMVIADNLAPFVNEAFNNPLQSTHTIYNWTAVVFFALQIYYDFSGYSNIAIGLLRWMGYGVPANFNHPYVAASLREFWQRWHISLSTWFRDYVYIPLGGSETRGWRGPNANMWITMLLSGLWHGASLNFVIWGALHAAFLHFERITSWPERLKKFAAGHYIAIIFTMFQVLIAWVFFRCMDYHRAFDMLGYMLLPHFTGASGLGFKHLLLLLLAVLPELLYSFDFNLQHKIPQGIYSYAEVGGVAFLLVMCVYLRGPGLQFIYFQF
jgi:D-alanyl-lipoteichoic acid acyltransferase DltB (MBOAT superfamily)